MRKLFPAFLTMCAVSVLLITGCTKEQNIAEETAIEKNTLADILRDETRTYQANSNNVAARAGNKEVKFTLLTYALTKTGLINDLAKAKGNYTLFAPTDDAFRAAGFTSIRDIQNLPNSVLEPILLYHVVGARVLASEVPAGPNAAVGTLNGADLFLTRKPGPMVYVNGNAVIVADIRAINGVMHAIDRILMPPSGDIVETAIADTNFSYLVAAVVRANAVGLLKSNGPLTVFAPKNQAFIDAGFTTIADINAADPALLLSILGYHVINGRVFSSDLSDGMTPNMYSGGTTTISLMNRPTIEGNSNSSPSNIVAVNIVTTNGVIHVIDRVLLP